MKLFQDFFKIRQEIILGQRILLGIIPIFAIFAIWHYATSGTVLVVTIPDGIFGSEGAEQPPEPGIIVPDGSRLLVKGWELRFIEERNYLLNGPQKLPIPFRVQERGGTIRIRLPYGKFLDRHSLPQEAPDISSAPSALGRGAGALSALTPASRTASLLEFQYEMVETRLLNPQILPSPWEVIRANREIWRQRDLFKNLTASFERVLLGFLMANLVVLPLGILMGSFRKCHAMFSPLMIFGGYLPIPALVPLTMSLFGLNETQKVMFLALAFAIYLLPLFVKAIEDVDNVYLLTAYTLGASRFQTVRHVLVAISLPNIFEAMRMGFGIGWGYIILAEMVDLGAGGVGAMILTSQRRGLQPDIYLILIAIVVLAFITDKIWDVAGQKLFPYRSLKR